MRHNIISMEGFQGGGRPSSLVPFQTFPVFRYSYSFSLIVPRLTYYTLTTFSHHRHQHLIVHAVPKPGSYSLFPSTFSLSPLFPKTPWRHCVFKTRSREMCVEKFLSAARTNCTNQSCWMLVNLTSKQMK